MVKLQIFVVYHKFLFPECYANIKKELLQYITFVAVNPDIEKIYPEGVKLIKEWELPIYDKSYQENVYNENSWIFHVLRNGLHKEYDYVGFCQYDMKLGDFSNLLENLSPTKFITHDVFKGKANYKFVMLDSWNGGEEVKTRNVIESSFEEWFQRPLTRAKEYPLLNTYILPSAWFEKIVEWSLHVNNLIWPWAAQPPNSTVRGHIASVFERIHALAIAELLDQSEHVWPLEHPGYLKSLCY